MSGNDPAVGDAVGKCGVAWDLRQRIRASV